MFPYSNILSTSEGFLESPSAVLVPAEQCLDCLLISTPARPNECLFRCHFGSTASASHFLPPKFASMDKAGCAKGTADVPCPAQTLHHIVVTTRVQCHREVKFLRKELIAEGSLGVVTIADRQESC
jgi:hypothetical protein